jgi:hypothetical protein
MERIKNIACLKKTDWILRYSSASAFRKGRVTVYRVKPMQNGTELYVSYAPLVVHTHYRSTNYTRGVDFDMSREGNPANIVAGDFKDATYYKLTKDEIYPFLMLTI